MKHQTTNCRYQSILGVCLLGFFALVSLSGPKKIGCLSGIGEVKAVQARVVASLELPKSTATSTTLTSENSIVIREEANAIKIEVLENLKTQSGPIGSVESFDASFNRFFTQYFYNRIFCDSINKDIFNALFAFRAPLFPFKGKLKFSQIVEKNYRQNLEKQMVLESSRLPINQLQKFVDNPLNELLPTCHKYLSYGTFPLERQLGSKMFSEDGTTKKVIVKRSKFILDAINLAIPEKHFRFKSILDSINTSLNVGSFDTKSVSKRSKDPESTLKHRKCFVYQKYYMAKQMAIGREARRLKQLGRLGQDFITNKYPAKVMNHFNFGTEPTLGIVFPPKNNFYPLYRIHNNGKWHNENEIASKERGSFYEFNLLPTCFAISKQDNVWSKHLTKYCNLNLNGTRSKSMNRDSVEVDIDCGKIGFDILRTLTEKASNKFPVIKQAQPTINLMTSGAEELFKFKFKLSYANYRSLYVVDPDLGFYAGDNPRPELVRSFNFNFHMEDRTFLNTWSYVDILNEAGEERAIIDGERPFIFPGAPEDSQPIHSKTYKDCYFYRGKEVDYISIANKLIRLTHELTALKSVLVRMKELREVLKKKPSNQ